MKVSYEAFLFDVTFFGQSSSILIWGTFLFYGSNFYRYNISFSYRIFGVGLVDSFLFRCLKALLFLHQSSQIELGWRMKSFSCFRFLFLKRSFCSIFWYVKFQSLCALILFGIVSLSFPLLFKTIDKIN